MIRSKTNQTNITLDALTIFAELHSLQGYTSQIYYEVSGTYESDRRYTPLVLFPDLYVNDPAKAMTGIPAISGIEWYSDVPKKTASGEDDTVTNRISNPSASVLADEERYRNVDYLISDGSNAAWCAGVPKDALIVHKNVPSITGQQIYAVVKFLDTRTNSIVRKQCSISLATEYFDDTYLDVIGDRGKEWIMDPIGFPEPLTSGNNITSEVWQRNINAQLRLKGVDVADAKASYLWLVRDTSAANGWREFTASETDKLLISGAKTKSLTLDIRYIDHSLSLRCYAAQREEGAAWANPFGGSNPFYEINLVMEMSQELNAHIVQTKGFDQNFDMNRTCHYDIQLKYGQQDVPTAKAGLFRVTWKAINRKTFATQTLGTGMSIEFNPSTKGFSFPEGFGVYAEVCTYKTKALGGTVNYSTNAPVRSGVIHTGMELEPLTVWGDLVILQGQASQSYDDATGTYESDRRYVPLILNGVFYVNDPLGEMTGTPTISSIEWYDDVPQKTAQGDDDYVTHRISNPSASVLEDEDQYRNVDYLISDGSNAAWCAGVPKDALIVHKNVSYLTAQQIYAVIKFVDTRTNTTIRKQCSIALSTEFMSANSLRVIGDRGKEWIMDPLAFPEPLTSGNDITEEPWQRTINAQLQLSGIDVDDQEACYGWVVRDDSAARGWREFTDLEKEFLLMSSPNVKSLSIDMRFVKRSITVRCYGKKRESGASWSSPFADGKPFYECCMTLEMNQELKPKIIQTKGFDLKPQMSTRCHYDIKLMYGQRTVPSNKMGLFRVRWIGVDNKTLAANIVGNGNSLDLIPSEKGYSYPNGFAIYAEVLTFACMAFVVDNGKYVTEDSDSNTLVISEVYE